ncbi:UNVERIFIED_ORG: ACS family hexuronate transporter-like MFS transporter [Pantoea brenneri]|nr:ACS family hexuronate transporter-like MFS transporter [Pantoea brenneri]
MTTEQYSWVVAAFQLAYTLFQPICGWLIDVIGLKMGFLICALIWSVTCLLHAGAGSWLHLALLRFVMGASEAAATPANAKAIGDWFPKKERPVAAGWAGVGFSIGAMLAPPIIYVAHITFGWQGAFLLTGGLGLLWVALWWWGYHSPESHPRLSDEERAFINQDNEAIGEKLPFFTALKVIGKEKKFYGIAIPAFLAEPAWAVLSFWVPLYLANERGMDLKQIVMFAWLPFLAADLGSVASGYLTKIYVRWFGLTRVNSIVASSVTGALLMVSLALMTLVKDPWLAIALISVGGFGHQVISCMLSALVVERFDRRQMATVNGMRGSCAWIASFIFSLIIGVTADTIGFNPLFVAMGFFDLIGAVFLVMLVAERRQRPANP